MGSAYFRVLCLFPLLILLFAEVALCVYVLSLVAAVMPPKRRGRGRGRSRGDAQPEGDTQAELLATMRAMQDELRTLRQANRAGAAQPVVPDGAVPAGAAQPILPDGAVPMGAAQPAAGGDGHQSGVSLKEWVRLKLESFDGNGTPIQAADWLSYIEMQLDAFEVLPQDRVRYVVQIMKGEAQIWWRGVQSARTAAHGVPTWPEFVAQFERRFYSATFLDKMQIELNNYTQGKMTVAEYEVGFNKIVRFVSHVANNDAEKARRFRQGLRPFIRHMLGAFPVTDFRTMVEQASGVELQQTYTDDIRKASGTDQ